jgi:class 3 adenylate cyclase/tetratricopeptide (TPR) repeat protein
VTTRLDTFASFLPAIVRRSVATAGAGPVEPRKTPVLAGSLFADISGFTQLAGELARRGPSGAEVLGRVLNQYFGQLVDTVQSLGGDVLNFAGDALFAVWPAEDVESLHQATWRAADCALEVQRRLEAAIQVAGLAAPVPISTRIGLGVGEVDLLQLGGILGRWETAIFGSALEQAVVSNLVSAPGGVALSPEVGALLGQQEIVAGHAPGSAITLDRLLRSPERSPLVAPTLDPAGRMAVRACIPGAIRAGLDAGLSAWLAELRQVTTLFVNLPGFNARSSHDMASLHRATRAVQEGLYRYEGSLNKFLVDEKGLSLLAAFGLPPLAHEDDAVRGVRAAETIRTRLEEQGHACSIGIASGRVFCGTIGSESRREYTILGDVVNKAARLMQAAGRDGILVDGPTRTRAEERLGFDDGARVRIKGWSEPVEVFRPTQVGGRTTRSATRAVTGPRLAGRDAERRFLAEAVRKAADGEGGSVTLVEGEAGIGKSALYRALVDEADRRALPLLVGSGDSLEQLTPLHAWRPVLAELGEEDDLPELLERDELAPEARARRIHDRVVELLRRRVEAGPPPVLVLEDAHWMDSASWGLTLAVARRVEGLALLLFARPLEGDLEVWRNQLLDRAQVRSLSLTAIDGDAVVAMACELIGVEALPSHIADLLRQRTHGNPFYVGEVVRALLDAGVFRVEAGRCVLGDDVDPQDPGALPDSLQGVVTSRIDRLLPEEQLLLKVASVMGRAFDVDLLRRVHPVEAERPRVEERLPVLRDAQLIEPMPGGRWRFQHDLARDATYNLMLSTQRQQLHLAVAEALEGRDEATEPGILALHWTRAGVRDKAVDALEAAGEVAAAAWSRRETVRFLNKALELAPDAAASRRRRWLRLLGEAWYQMGVFAAARDHAVRALELGSRPVPGSVFGRLVAACLGLAGHSTRLMLPTLWRGLSRERPPEVVAAARDEAELCDLLGDCDTWEEDQVGVLYWMTRGLRLAERHRLFGQLDSSYGKLDAIACMLGMHRLAARYRSRAAAVSPLHDRHHLRGLGVYFTGLGRFGLGMWDEHDRLMLEAGESFRQGGNLHDHKVALLTAQLAAYFHGDLEGAVAGATEVGREARLGSDAHIELLALALSGRALVALGRTEDGVARLLEARNLLASSLQSFDAYTVRQVRIGEVLARRAVGNLEEVGRLLEAMAAEGLLIEHLVTPASIPPDLVCELLLDLWGRDVAAGTAPDASRWAAEAGRAIGRLKTTTRAFPFREPTALRHAGWRHWIRGRTARARRAWRRGLELAVRLEIRSEQAWLHLALAASGDEPERRRAAARTLLDEVGVAEPPVWLVELAPVVDP